MRCPGQEEVVEVFEDLLVGEQGLDELLLVGPRELVKVDLAEVFEGSG